MRIVAFSPRPPVARTVGAIVLASFLAFAFSGGGRLVGSDEVTVFELSRAMLRGGIAIPEGATLTGPDGRHYSKSSAAQAVLALPLVAAGEAVASAARLPPAKRVLAARFVVSFFNALVTAVLLGTFYAVTRALGVSPGIALASTLLLGFTTPLWVYSKSFMTEPLQALGLLAALAGCAGAGQDPAGSALGVRAASGASRAAALGVFLAVSAKLSMLPLALACMVVLAGRPARAWFAPVAGLMLALAGHAIYNQMRFGIMLESGYGAQATAAAYTTPLLAGVYGLAISSGKGVMWFAPALWIALPVWLTRAGMSQLQPPARDADRVARRGLFGRLERLDAEARVRWGAALAALAALWLYGRFQHWAGDGSFGPRYLVPVLPLAFLVVALALERGSRAVRRWTVLLAVLGFLVQIGGVAIYFGAQMREAGDYPYTLPLEHPRSMSDSHFNPRYSPIVGHWRLLVRNAGEHLRGAAPELNPDEAARESGTGDPAATARLGITAADQQKLLHALDFWWLYLVYAGFPRAVVWGVAAALLIAALWAARRAWQASRAEAAA